MNTEIINGEYDFDRKLWLLHNGQFQCRIVINCAELYGDHIEQIHDKSSFTIQPRIGQFSVYSSSSNSLVPIKSMVLLIPKLTKGIIVCPNLFNQIIAGPTAGTQIDRVHAPIKSEINEILNEKLIELIPTVSNFNYEYISSYTGVRPATEYSDYQIKFDQNLQWIYCGGIRSTGLTSSLAIGEYIYQNLEQIFQSKSLCAYEGYSSEKYFQSLEKLKSIFNLTSNSLQPKIIIKQESNVISKSVGDIKLGDNIQSLNLQIDCDDELFDISHSLLKLAWTTKFL